VNLKNLSGEIFCLENDYFVGPDQSVFIIIVHVLVNGSPTTYQLELLFKLPLCGTSADVAIEQAFQQHATHIGTPAPIYQLVQALQQSLGLMVRYDVAKGRLLPSLLPGRRCSGCFLLRLHRFSLAHG
jgi:hypothetical protein